MSDVLEQPDVAGGSAPDYELAATVRADTPAQLKALGDPTRTSILHLVLERAASTTELAEALGKPKGTVDHHVKVLERAGLLRVVRTRQVRALTERYWGRTGRTIIFGGSPAGDANGGITFLREAAAEMSRVPVAPCAPGADTGEVGYTTLRHARIAPERAAEFSRRLDELAVEFVTGPRGGDTVFGLVLGLYPTDQPTLPEPRPERAP